MMTKTEMEEIERYDLPDRMLDKLRKYVEMEPAEDEESAVTYSEDYSEMQYSKKVLADEVDETDLEYSQKLLKEVMESPDFPLDLALDTYDPGFTGYTPSEQAFEFFNLMRLVEGQDFEFNTPIAHYFMVDLLLNNITDNRLFPYDNAICDRIDINHLRIAFMCSRGMAKSSVVISFFGVYSAIKGKLPNDIGPVWFYLVLAASSRGGARVNALAVRSMCEDSKFLKDYFESMRFTESESEFVRKGTKAKKHRSFLIRYQGVGTGVRGIRYGERRICCIIEDDIILNEAAAYSKTITENLESMMHSDAVAALKGGGKGRIVNCFTPFSYTDVNTQLVMNGAYTPCVVPMARHFDADNMDLKAKDVESSWEAMHPSASIVQLIKDARKTKKLKQFLQERMLRLTSAAERLVPKEKILWYAANGIRDTIEYYNVVITTDFTTTSGEKSDYSGIFSWALSNNEDWFLLDMALRKQSITEQREEVFRQASRWKRMGKNVEIGVEIDGQQSAHVHALRKMMQERGDYYSFAKQVGAPEDRIGILSKNGGSNKHERFRLIVPRFLEEKVFLPEHLRETEDMKELVKELSQVTHTGFKGHDDGADCISQLGMMKLVYPTNTPSTTLNSIDGDDIWGEMAAPRVSSGAGY